jgi:hypothetical protein
VAARHCGTRYDGWNGRNAHLRQPTSSSSQVIQLAQAGVGGECVRSPFCVNRACAFGHNLKCIMHVDQHTMLLSNELVRQRSQRTPYTHSQPDLLLPHVSPLTRSSLPPSSNAAADQRTARHVFPFRVAACRRSARRRLLPTAGHLSLCH